MTDREWPAVAYEELPWHPDVDGGMASRTQRRKHIGPYRAAVVAPIARQALTLDAELLATADDATAELVRFDAEMGTEIAPFASVLLRSESAASSQIENLSASARAIAEAELGSPSGPNATQIVANVRAMDAAVTLADNLTVERGAEAILVMHRALMERLAPDIAGRWRDQQVWIGGGNLGPHTAMFVPPHHDRVEPAIDDLVEFIARDDLPVLAHAAIAHAQFETIHPFPDGNGRTGRALLHAMLRSKGLTRNVTVPISAGLLADTTAYFAALDAYRAGDPQVIVAQVADAAFLAVANGRQLVGELREIRATWEASITARRGAGAWAVADLLLRHPVINADLVAVETGVSVRNVYRAIEPLERAGVLVRMDDRARNRTWRAPQVLAALDTFAARAGRRTPGHR